MGDSVDLGNERPGRSRVCTLSQELRLLELKNALLALVAPKGDSFTDGMISRRNAHESPKPSHGRDFRTLVFSYLHR